MTGELLLALPKFPLYLGTALLVGGAALRMLWGEHSVPLRWLGWGFALLVLGALSQVAATLFPLGYNAPGDVFLYVTKVAAGRAVTLTLLGACVLLASEVGRLGALASVGAVLFTLYGLAGIGHGAAHGDAVRFLHTAHAGAVSVWLAGLFTVLAARQGGLARRFSPLALGCVLVLAGSGVWMTLSHAGTPLTLPDSVYGRTLLLKLAVFAGVLGAAFLVRRAVNAGLSFRRALAWETALLLAVLMVTPALTVQEPPLHQTGGHTAH